LGKFYLIGAKSKSFIPKYIRSSMAMAIIGFMKIITLRKIFKYFTFKIRIKIPIKLCKIQRLYKKYHIFSNACSVGFTIYLLVERPKLIPFHGYNCPGWPLSYNEVLQSFHRHTTP